MFVYFSDQNPEVLALPCPQLQGTSFPGLRSYLPEAVCAYLILLLVSVPCPVGSNQKAEIHSRTHLWVRPCPAISLFCFRAQVKETGVYRKTGPAKERQVGQFLGGETYEIAREDLSHRS